MNFNSLEDIKRSGFTGFRKMNELFIDNSSIPDSKGVYFILNLDESIPEFLPRGTGGFFKGKDPNVSLSELNSNWVEAAKLIYIGKATSLRSRLRQYFSFGQGRNVGHYGGRLIWQLKHSKDLVVCWKSLKTDPREYEADLIRQFVEEFGCRPFANLRD